MTGGRFTLGLLSLSLGLASVAGCDDEKKAAPAAKVEAVAKVEAPVEEHPDERFFGPRTGLVHAPSATARGKQAAFECGESSRLSRPN